MSDFSYFAVIYTARDGLSVLYHTMPIRRVPNGELSLFMGFVCYNLTHLFKYTFLEQHMHCKITLKILLKVLVDIIEEMDVLNVRISKHAFFDTLS